MRKHTIYPGFFTVLAVITLIMAAAPVSAQQLPAEDPPPVDFADEELEAFAAALVEIETIHTYMQQEMSEIIEDADMVSDRFYELHSHFTQTQGTLPEDITPDEESAFQQTFQALVEAEETTQMYMIEAIEAEDLEVETFNTIVAAAQQNPELWEEIQVYQDEYLEEREEDGDDLPEWRQD